MPQKTKSSQKSIGRLGIVGLWPLLILMCQWPFFTEWGHSSMQG